MRYTPYASDIELPFYASLASHKINHDKLDDSARKVLGLYEIRPSDREESSCRMQLHGNALTSDEVPAGYYRAEGLIKNVNTIEEYKSIDKAGLLQQAGRTIWEAIVDGTIYSCPSLLASFFVLSFADLKKYRFSYHFAFPALPSDPAWAPVSDAADGQSSTTQDLVGTPLSGVETTALVDSVQTWRYAVDHRQHGFFLAKKVHWLNNGDRAAEEEAEDQRPVTPKTPTEKLEFSWSISSLSAYETGFFKETPEENCFVGFADPSNYSQAPGWMLRNLLMLIRHRWGLKKVQILCYRDIQSKRDQGRSFYFSMALPSDAPTIAAGDIEGKKRDMPKVVGWERNPSGKVAGRLADLTEYMDPQRLADQSVDLNLKLMKWRISPNLNLDKIKNTKCLLLGAGTLGSYVARNLLGWGVRKITFVDNATVSFSNPVRQPLFDFKDCLEGGAKKAHRAAEALSEIYPGVDSVGHVMSVPMAGHPIIDTAKVRKDYDKLKELIDEHDVIFLLMDTRESRWLPTVMGKAAGKIVMNAALGFDTFVVMRHGVKLDETPALQLGCYFCNDVVAPANSTKDATLDQQCTVTRPGIAAIASALLVEVLVSVLQHPMGAAAPATTLAEDRGDHPLGVVPHQIRGFLATFTNMPITGKSYDCCSACSDRILDAYRTGGWDFIQRALNEKGYVEDLSGLTEVQRIAEKAAADIDWDESEGEIEDEGEGDMI